MHDTISLYVGVFVHIKDNTISQLLFIGAKRADKVTQPFGQHGYGAVYKIHTCGAFHGLFVDDAALGNVMTHVGYVHAHLPKALIEHANRQCIVEILGISRVDGAGKHVAEVLAFVVILLRYLGRNAFGSLFCRLGISVGQAVLGQDGVHLDIVFARRTKHINYFSHDILVFGIGPLGYFHHGLIARFAAFKLTFRHKDVVYI